MWWSGEGIECDEWGDPISPSPSSESEPAYSWQAFGLCWHPDGSSLERYTVLDLNSTQQFEDETPEECVQRSLVVIRSTGCKVWKLWGGVRPLFTTNGRHSNRC